jgi:tRNA(Ile)-lysidine synthase
MHPEPGLNAEEAAHLFAPLDGAAHVIVAVSGGADSTALLVLLAEWAKSRETKISAATIDHGLRAESKAEAKKVAALAKQLGVSHRVLAWTGEKPKTGIEEAARAARYALLDAYAQKIGATHLVTAHTEDDQAETVLMRLAAGSGPAGLAGMRARSRRGSLVHVRPLLGIAKARLVATLRERGSIWSEDAMNADARFARPRLRAARASLAAEGLTNERLAVLAGRMARVNDALERVAAAAWPEAARQEGAKTVLDGRVLLSLPEEVGLRLLIRAIGGHADQTPDRLRKNEAAYDAVRDALTGGRTAARTLAGAKISVARGEVTVSAAPPRRGQ